LIEEEDKREDSTVPIINENLESERNPHKVSKGEKYRSRRPGEWK
jgi:hypothetical protein